ncbi:beta strand repeat-containing protein [uncultured Bdellovibrio sp.]|uniref:beta strand repeat-containing protein n=1 Tax=Bdellovibrio sp. HCB-162 TaxID=3394234 RepID=UPI0025EC7586|nr:hypothetical protein [uncultured Bdellovibrio sp.]
MKSRNTVLSLVSKRVRFALVIQLSIASIAFADCPLNISSATPLMCNSYEFGMPVNITNPTGGPSLTVMDGHVGIGVLNPLARLDVAYGIPTGDSADHFVANQSTASINVNSNYSGTISSVIGHIVTGPAQEGVINSVTGVSGVIKHSGIGSLTNATGLQSSLSNVSTGTITNAYGLTILAPLNTGGGTVENFYGVYVDTPTAANTNFAVYSKGGLNYFGGNVGIGTTTPSSELDVAGVIRADQICDRNGTNCKVISTGWGSGGGGGSGSGTVTSIATGTGLVGGTITTSGTISVDVGTTANKIVQLNSTAQLPAINGANLTDINASKISGSSVSILTATSGQYLGYNGTSWTNKSISISDISNLSTQLSNKLDASNMPASCGVNQTLTFTSPTGMWACSDIVIIPSAFGSQAQNLVLASPSNSSGTATFRTLSELDLPSSVTSALWTSSGSNIYRSAGNVGIGTSTPTSPLTVSGTIESTSGGFKFPDGSVQTTAASGGGGGSSIGAILPIGIQIGNQSFGPSAQGTGNIAIGLGPLQSLTNGSNNIAIGMNAMLTVATPAQRNVAIGNQALKMSTYASDNVAVGDLALSAATTSVNNVAIGSGAGKDSTASENVYIGPYTGISATSSGSVVAIGSNASRWTTSGKSIAIGYRAANANKTGDVIAIGKEAASASTTGSIIAIGTNAGFYNGAGTQNIAIGQDSLVASHGNNNIAIGHSSGYYLTTGSGNIILGTTTENLTTSSSNNIIIGYNLGPAVYEGSNILAIGNAIYGTNADSSSPVTNAKIGIGTKTPGSLLDVAGTLRVEKICDRNGTNCKTLASGWNLSSQSNQELIGKINTLQKRNDDLEKRLAHLEKLLSTKAVAKK